MAISDLFKQVIKLESKATGMVYNPPILNTEIKEDLITAIEAIVNKSVRKPTDPYLNVVYGGTINFSKLDMKELLRVLRLYEEYL